MPVGLMVAVAAGGQVAPIAVLAPLCALLAVFAGERRRRLDHALELSRAYRGTALLLGEMIEHDDDYTGSHSRDVVDLALAVGARLGLDGAQFRRLEFGALLHDIGKIATPKEILHKPAALSDEEWAVMRRHTVEGQLMLEGVGGSTRRRRLGRPQLPRALGRRGLPRRAGGRGDPGRVAHLRRVRRVQRDDDQPALPPCDVESSSPSSSCARTPAPSSTPASSTRWSPNSALPCCTRRSQRPNRPEASRRRPQWPRKLMNAIDPARDGGDGEGMKLARMAALTIGGLMAVLPATASAAAIADCQAPRDCPPPLAAFGDLRPYFVAPGGDFETSDWTLAGGAALTTGSGPLEIGAAESSLRLPSGGSATSPVFCVDLDYPTLRFFSAQHALKGSSNPDRRRDLSGTEA